MSKRRERITEEEKVIAILYTAIQKPAWEEGPTDSEAISAANDWWYRKHGYEKDAASAGIPKMHRARKGARHEKQ